MKIESIQVLTYLLSVFQAVIILLLGVVGFWVKQFVQSTNKFTHEVIRMQALLESQEKNCIATHQRVDKRFEKNGEEIASIRKLAESTDRQVIKIKEHLKT